MLWNIKGKTVDVPANERIFIIKDAEIITGEEIRALCRRLREKGSTGYSDSVNTDEWKAARMIEDLTGLGIGQKVSCRSGSSNQEEI